jgi:glucokinase
VAAALGEYRYGAGQGAERLLLVTLGTGIGVALLEHGEPFRLGDGQHPDAGHIPVTGYSEICYCGLTGCWEQSASRLALERALEPLLEGTASPVELLTTAATRARLGDTKAKEAFIAYGREVGRGLALFHAVFGPSITVIGGTVADYLDLFEPGVNESLTRAAGYAFPVPIVRAELGSEAGAIGAAILARSEFGRERAMNRKTST